MVTDDNICYSDHNSVHTMIMAQTYKQGCHLVINTATGAFREVRIIKKYILKIYLLPPKL